MKTFTLPAADGLPLFVYQWLPPGPPRAIVQIVHGMAEHAGRYDALAQALMAAEYAVYAHDLRGHGKMSPHLGIFGPAGWRGCLSDIGVVNERIIADFPELPVVLFGHSMGSFQAQHFAADHEGTLAGLVLSGTYRESRWLARAGALLAGLERMRLGKDGRSPLLHALTIGAFNRKFAPNRTSADWLSRDPAAVDLYLADPCCGFRASIGMWEAVLNALADGLPLPPATLPVLVMVGEVDPVCGPDPGARKLVDLFRRQSADTHVTHKVYRGARHELFHETNRAEVTRDLIAWLGSLI